MKKILSILAASALLCAPISLSASADSKNCGIRDILSKIRTAYTYSCGVNCNEGSCDISALVEKLCKENCGQDTETKEELQESEKMQSFFEKDGIISQLKDILKKEPSETSSQAPESEKDNGDKQEALPDSAGDTISDINAEQVVELVNAERKKAGLSEVTYDAGVSCAAQKRAVETESLFSHTRPDGSRCFTALDECGVSYRGAGENIAMGQNDAAEVMNDWMNSQGHRENILNPSFTKIGVGIHKGADGRYYWTQMFTY